MAVVAPILWTLDAWGVGVAYVAEWVVGVTVVVGVVVVVVAVVPAWTMDVVVVGAVVVVWVVAVGVGVITRHVPSEDGVGGLGTGAVEAECGCCTIDLVVGIEPDAAEVDRHEDLLAGVGVVGIDPDLVEGRVEGLCPEFVDERIGGDLVWVAAIDHHLVLAVEIGEGALGLRIIKIPDLVG